ncbi:AraC family transcriptional regulator [Motiliproteus coralliicola]|nr:AraC family transcriptional regulator [Motiliproteus coralliicola]
MKQMVTSSSGWIVAVSRALTAAGCDVESMFAAAELDLAQATDPNSRFPVEQMARVWRAAVVETGDEALGLRVADYVKPTTFHALGYAMLASGTLREAFKRLESYFTIVSDAGTLVFEEGEPECRLLLQRSSNEAGRPVASDQALDAFVASILGICRDLHQPDFAPLRVELGRAQPAKIAPYESLFDCPVTFGMPATNLYFSTSELDQPLPTANAELAVQSDKVVRDYLSRLQLEDVVGLVKAKVIDMLPDSEPSQERVADALHLSLRSLQRKLSQAGTSYTQVLEGVRHELAEQYLQQSHLSVSEICFMLGFASLSSFSRAFKRWTGVSPAHYRADRLGLS